MELYPHTHPENTTTATTPDGPHWPPSVEGPSEKQPRSGALGVIGGSLDGLRYARMVVEGRRVLNRPAAYVAALDDITIFLDAAIERVENGQPMQSTSIVQ